MRPQDGGFHAPDKADDAGDDDRGDEETWRTIANRAESLVKWHLS